MLSNSFLSLRAACVSFEDFRFFVLVVSAEIDVSDARFVVQGKREVDVVVANEGWLIDMSEPIVRETGEISE
jgi:hypothetical protein